MFLGYHLCNLKLSHLLFQSKVLKSAEKIVYKGQICLGWGSFFIQHPLDDGIYTYNVRAVLIVLGLLGFHEVP